MRNEREIIFTKKVNPSAKIIVRVYPNGVIKEIENPTGFNFPFSIGQLLQRNIENWACVAGWYMDGKNMCGEEKVYGIPVSKIPKGHELRILFPNKFKGEGGEVLIGGLADNMTLKDIAEMHHASLELIYYQATLGVKVEREHTANIDEIREIVKDHLYENPYYYTMLKDMESSYDAMKQDANHKHWVEMDGATFKDLKRYLLLQTINFIELPAHSVDRVRLSVSTSSKLDKIFLWMHNRRTAQMFVEASS